jgi:hypothetical protein
MEKEQKRGQMEQNIKETTVMEEKKAEVYSLGLMGLRMKENLTIITFKDLGNTFGQMEDNTKGIGLIIKCMEMVNLNGQMEKDTKDLMSKIKKKAMEYLNGVMVENIWVSGKMENNTEKELLLTEMEKKQLVNGKKEKKLISEF